MTPPEPLFGGRSFAAFLFDMDGTLLSSIEAAERVWGRWAERFGLDVPAFLPTIHGMRAVETIGRLGLPNVDVEAEAALLLQDEMDDIEGIHPIPGVHDFLLGLPPHRWAIVTSAPRALALRRLGAIGLQPPAVMVVGEDIEIGKPDPACFLLAAGKLGFAAGDCLVFEDAPAGIRAGEASGASVMVVTGTHRHPMDTHHPAIADYRGLRTVAEPDGRLRLRGPITI